MRFLRPTLGAFCGVLLTSVALGAICGDKLTAAQAKDHIGETATVCGSVASARYAEKTKGSPTFINLDKPYPQHVFTVVIWGSDRAKFGQPEENWKDKKICVTGKIQEFQSKPEIVVKDPSQVVVEK